MLAMSEMIDGICPSKLSAKPEASDRNDVPPEGWLCGEPLPELDGAFCTLPDPPELATTLPRESADTRPLSALPLMTSADARVSLAEETPAKSEANSLEIRSEEVDRSIPQFHPSMWNLGFRDSGSR